MKPSRLSLRNRLLLTVLLPVALLLAALVSASIVRGERMTERAIAERGLAIVSFLAPAAEYGVISGSSDIIDNVLGALRSQGDVAAAVLYDRDGGLLAQRGEPRILDVAQVRRTGAAVSLSEGLGRKGFAAPVRSMALVVDELNTSPGQEPEGVAPVGWVYVEIDIGGHEAERRMAQSLTIGMAFLTLFITTILALRLANSVGEPVARLAQAVRRMAAGELDVQVPDTTGGEELRALERGFNSMARSIANAHKNLQSRIDEATEQLAHQALHDPLTGLPNRRAFERTLEETVAASRRAGDRGALCFVDLDHFKYVNDSAGHAAGDALLRAVADIFRQRLRGEDFVCRIGGDEFALILRGCAREDARRVAEGMCKAIADLRFEWGGREFRIGASIGFVMIDGRVTTVAEVLREADHACYSVKRDGRGQVAEYSVLAADRA